jgi:peroxiredoxin
MARNLGIALLASVFFIVSLLSLSSMEALGGEAGTKNQSPPAGAPMAPDFSLKDLNGKARSLKDYRGKVVLLNFTTTWCPYCKKDIPNLKKLHASMKGRDFELVSVYVMESQKKVADFVEKYSLPYTVLIDSDATAARMYGVRGVPTKVVVAKNGVIGCWQCLSAEEKIDELLKVK